MSAGSPHHRPNLRHASELPKLLRSGGAPALMRRWQRLDVDHDIADLAGYNVWGTVRYLDRDFFRALLDADYARAILGAPIDTGLSPRDTVECILEHEAVEKVLLDADNDIDNYLDAHEYATAAEHAKVVARGGKPITYERGLRPAIKFCERNPLKNVAPDYACAPYLDDPDSQDLRTLKVLRELGVADAFKSSKAAAGYGKSTTSNQCVGCAHWRGPRTADLALCQVVDGLVRRDRWCKFFKAMGDSHGQAQQGASGLQGGGEGHPAPGPVDQGSGSGSGGSDAASEPGGQEGQSAA